MDIKKGDTVVLLNGRFADRFTGDSENEGQSVRKRGQVLQVFPKDDKVIVEGMNQVWKHRKPKAPGGRGMTFDIQAGRIQMPAPIPRGKVMLVCPRCDKPTKIGRLVTGDGRKVRACRKCSEQIDE